MTDTIQAIDQQDSLASLIEVNQSGVRSINIERDLPNPDIAERYILTTQSRLTLDRLLSRFNGAASVRAWTLTGPYGSGKSFFSLFLMNLACPSQPAHLDTRRRLAKVDPFLLETAVELFALEQSAGLLPVAITGYRAPIVDCLKHGLKHALQCLPATVSLQAQSAALDNWSDQTDSRSIVRWFEALIATVVEPELGYRGLLLIFDEMGKPLEFAAAHPDKADVYLLQELAEFANRSSTTPLVFVSILHQSFERYAALLDVATQQEWAKVQGRFEDVAFQEPPALQMRLVASAIQPVEPARLTLFRPQLDQTVQEAVASGWCPPLMDEDEFTRLCHRTYPLHPAALVALPFIFRRLAQNERSIFAYLASAEPFGFQEFLLRHKLPDFVLLADLYDYLMANFQGRLYASGRARVLLETQERLQSTSNLDLLEIETIKTIGLLNWLSEISHLQATASTLFMALRTPTRPDQKLREVLQKLQKRSLIVYRRFNDTYSVWQGSDVDLEEQLHKARQKLSGSFSVASTLQRYLPPRPLVARRHSYETGTLRYFEVEYVDSFTRDKLALTPGEGASGKILLCLPANPAEVGILAAWAESPELQEQPAVIIGVVSRAMRLTELLHELRCLHWVRENTPELRDDPVARRELRLRLATIELLVNNELDRGFSLHQLAELAGCQWYYRGEYLSTPQQKGLLHLLSNICDTLYAQTPYLWNELINRRSLSSQGAAARRNLIEAILTKPHQPILGITGFPPERSMYESLLLASRLHVEVMPGRWAFQPLPAEDPLQLKYVWQAMTAFVFSDPPQPRPVDQLFAQLGQPPFGLTDGVLPLLLCAFLAVYQAETTLYREGTLLPEPGIADWEVLLRRPELFQVAGCKVTGHLEQVVARFAHGLGTETAVMPVVRDLMRRFKTLPEHTWRTQRLSEQARALRRVIDNARSPEQLLFQEIPEALELPQFTSAMMTTSLIDTFFERLNAVITELANDVPRLQKWARDHFLLASGLSGGQDGWGQFLGLAQEMAPRVVNPNLGPLLRRAAEASDPHAALESVLALIAGRPLRTWSDTDSDRYAVQARFLGNLLQAERNGSAPTISLNETERRRSLEIIEEIQEHLQEQYDAAERPLLQVALQLLAQQYQTKLTDEPL